MTVLTIVTEAPRDKGAAVQCDDVDVASGRNIDPGLPQ